MLYEKTDRIQSALYETTLDLLADAIETLLDEEVDVDQVNILVSEYTAEELIKTICQTQINDFEFILQSLSFNRGDGIDEYRVSICDDGEVYVEHAMDKDGNYFDCDGFIFAESCISPLSAEGNNRHCDVMVFDINE